MKAVENGYQQKIARDRFSELGLSLNQSRPIKNVNQNNCPIKTEISNDYLDLTSRMRTLRKHTVKPSFYKDFTNTHQKALLVQINKQILVNEELQN